MSESDPPKYFRYLPAVYSAPQIPGTPSHPFLGEYLKIFEKLLTGRNSAELQATSLNTMNPDLVARKGMQETIGDDVISGLFYPRLDFLFASADDGSFMPPISNQTTTNSDLLNLLSSYFGPSAGAPPPNTFTEGYRILGMKSTQSPIEQWLNGLLSWLGTCIALDVNRNWSIDKKRWVIAQMIALYRVRGSVQGMQWLLDLWFDLKVPGANPPDGKTPNFTVTVSNPQLPPLIICDRYPPLDSAVVPAYPKWTVAEVYTVDKTPVISDIVSEQFDKNKNAVWAAYLPWLFDVNIGILNNGNQTAGVLMLKGQAAAEDVLSVKTFIDTEKPAGTRYLATIVPTLFLGWRGGPLPANLLDETDERAMSNSPNLTTRLVYTDGMLLTAANMTIEQSYLCDRLAYLVKSFWSKGLINGLYVSINSDKKSISVEEGAAIDDSGRMLYYPAANPFVVPSLLLGQDGPCYLQLTWPTTDNADVTATLECVASVDPNSVQVATLTVSGGMVAVASQANGDCDVAAPKTWQPKPHPQPHVSVR